MDGLGLVPLGDGLSLTIQVGSGMGPCCSWLMSHPWLWSGGPQGQGTGLLRLGIPGLVGGVGGWDRAGVGQSEKVVQPGLSLNPCSQLCDLPPPPSATNCPSVHFACHLDSRRCPEGVYYVKVTSLQPPLCSSAPNPLSSSHRCPLLPLLPISQA